MNIKKLVKLLIYRCAEKGFEILIIPSKDPQTGKMSYKFPKGLVEEIPLLRDLEERIQLNYANPENPDEIKRAIAVEGDYHEVPSLREEIKNDVNFISQKFMEHLPEIEKGTFVSLKDVFRNILPYEYELLKELKEIVTDRNVIKNI